MTVKELKDELNKHPDDSEVVVRDSAGEYLFFPITNMARLFLLPVKVLDSIQYRPVPYDSPKQLTKCLVLQGDE